MLSALKKLEAGGEAAESVEKPHSLDECIEELTHTKEEARKEDNSVDSSCFCIHCGEYRHDV